MVKFQTSTDINNGTIILFLQFDFSPEKWKGYSMASEYVKAQAGKIVRRPQKSVSQKQDKNICTAIQKLRSTRYSLLEFYLESHQIILIHFMEKILVSVIKCMVNFSIALLLCL